MSDSDSELAELRAQRAAKLGSAGLTLTSLRERQRAQAARDESLFVAEPADARRHGNGAAAPRAAAQDDDEDDDEAPAVEDGVGIDDLAQQDMRAHFPMSFGEQEPETLRLDKIHAATVRGAAGEPPPIDAADTASGFLARGSAAGGGGAAAAPGARSGGGGASASRTDRVGAGLDRVEEDGNGALPGPAPPPGEGAEGEEEAAVGPLPPDEGLGSGLGEEDEEDDPWRLPITHEVAFEAQSKVVAALDVDRAGARVLAGSRDYGARVFDFNGMKADLRAFRQLVPCEGHPVHALSWSPSGDAFLCVTGSAKIKVYDRDGSERAESVLGDPYIRDTKNTKGHQSPCTSGHWHPSDRHTALTASEDGTLRVWDTETAGQRTVVKPTVTRPGRVAVTACAYGDEGALIAAGLVSGTLQLWDAKGKFGTSAAIGQVLPPKAQMVQQQDWKYVSGGGRVLKGAHAPGSAITSLAFSRGGFTLLSRSEDETLKLWDTRKFKAPLHVWEGLPASFESTKAIFSPDERLVVTGTSADRSGRGGAVVFFDAKTHALVHRVAMPGSAVALNWHERLNQILVGVGDKSSGCVRALYDPTFSERGVLMCAGRKLRAKDPFDFQAPLLIHTPHALPMFREPRPTGKRKREKERADPIKSQMPDRGGAAPLKPGTGGKIGATGGTLLTQYVLKNQGMLRKPEDEDIRASILRHAGKEDDQFNTFTKAYAKTQPQRIFEDEEEEEGAGGGGAG